MRQASPRRTRTNPFHICCRTCIRRLASGQVAYRIEWPGLSAEEKQTGYILPCVAYPLSDLVIAAAD